MDLIRQYTDVSPVHKGAVVVLGNFDGVHLGHQAVIGKAKDIARRLDVPLGVIVFEPHPREVFRPDDKPFRLTTLETKARLLEKEGVDILFAFTFDRELASKEPADFVQEALIDGLGVVHLVVGHDFRYGARRAGDATALAYMGEMEGFGVTVVNPVSISAPGRPDNDDEIYSSTLIRNLLREGSPADAARLLGHNWTVEGEVLKGDQRGRTIGFPTANLDLEQFLKPAHGVYAVQVEVFEGPHTGIYDGVANVGTRPTFDKREVNLEVHIFRFAGDLYGTRIAVSFIDFIREEQKFDGLEALKSQIHQDCRRAEDILAEIKATA